MVAGRLGEEASRMRRTQTLWNRVRLGAWLPSPGGLETVPSQGEASAGAHPGPQPRLPELPAPTRGISTPPLPNGRSSSHSVYYCSLSASPPLAWEEPAGWQLGRNLLSPCGCQRHRALSPPDSSARVRPLGDLVPAKAAPIPVSHCPSRIAPALQGLHPSRVEVRAPRVSRGEKWPQKRQRLWVGRLPGENNSRGHRCKPINTITPSRWGETVSIRQLLPIQPASAADGPPPGPNVPGESPTMLPPALSICIW